VPKQVDLFDCGVFLLMYVKKTAHLLPGGLHDELSREEVVENEGAGAGAREGADAKAGAGAEVV
jgi:hypothetical protein